MPEMPIGKRATGGYVRKDYLPAPRRTLIRVPCFICGDVWFTRTPAASWHRHYMTNHNETKAS